MDWGRRRLIFLVGLLAGLALVGIVVAISGTVPVSGGVSLEAPDGMNATLTGSTDALLTNPFPNSETVEWTTEAGNITFSATGPAAATVDVSDITGTTSRVTALDVSSNAATITPEDKQSVVVGAGLTSLTWRDEGDIFANDGNVDISYASSGDGFLRIGGLPDNQQIAAVDATTGTLLDANNTNNQGRATFDSLDGGSHDVVFQTFSAQTPVISNPSPTGPLSNEPTQLEVDVNDTEFSRGDSVDVTISLDGTQIHSTTIGSNSTITTAIPQSGQTGGQHNWTVTAEDSFGNVNTEGYTYSVPDRLFIRNARDHDQVLNQSITINGTFFGTTNIFVRDNVTDGIVNMTGLPVNQDFVFEADPSLPAWTQRTLFVSSIYEQQSIYLLNTSAVPTVDTRFVLNDPTGEYDASSLMYIQRPINISGNTTWQTVHSDRFGVEGITAELQQEQRYRIRVSNPDGDYQIVGPYRADTSETVEVQPGTPTIELGPVKEGWAANSELLNDTLEYRYFDPENATDQLTVWIHETGDPTNYLVPNSTYFDVKSVSAQESLFANQTNKSWDVVFAIQRGNDTIVYRQTLTNRQDLFGELGDNWQVMIGIGALFLLAGAFSLLNASVGAVIVSLMGGLLWWVGLLDGATTGIAVVLAILISAAIHMQNAAGP